MTENTWIPAIEAVPDEDGATVEMRFADGEVLEGQYNDGHFVNPVLMLQFSGVKEWRLAADGCKD